MSDLTTRGQVIAYIRSLSDEDLARLFTEATSTRNEYRRREGGEFWNHVYVVGVASHMSGGPAEIEILATSMEPVEVPDDIKRLGANEGGKCQVCETILASTSKIAACPVCGARVECT